MKQLAISGLYQKLGTQAEESVIALGCPLPSSGNLSKSKNKTGGGGAIEIVIHYLADCKLFILMSSTHGVERVLRR